MEEGCVVHVMGKPVANAGVAAAASTVPTTAGASVTLPAVNNMNIGVGASASPLAAALTKLRTWNDGTTYCTALETADKLLGNIVSHVSTMIFISCVHCQEDGSMRGRGI